MHTTGTLIETYFERLAASPSQKLFEGVEYPWEALAHTKDILEHLASGVAPTAHVAPSAVITGSVQIGEGSVVHPGVVIEGPVIIGRNVEVRPHAWIRGNTIIGDSCVIGHGSEVKHAILFSGAKLGTNVFVGDSILGEKARMGSGAIIGNRRFDQEEVVIKIDVSLFPTGTDKFGALIGDAVRIGANATLSPGTLVGKHTWVYGGAAIRGIIPPQSLVKLRQEIVTVPKERTELRDTDASGKR